MEAAKIAIIDRKWLLTNLAVVITGEKIEEWVKVRSWIFHANLCCWLFLFFNFLSKQDSILSLVFVFPVTTKRPMQKHGVAKR